MAPGRPEAFRLPIQTNATQTLLNADGCQMTTGFVLMTTGRRRRTTRVIDPGTWALGLRSQSDDEQLTWMA